MATRPHSSEDEKQARKRRRESEVVGGDRRISFAPGKITHASRYVRCREDLTGIFGRATQICGLRGSGSVCHCEESRRGGTTKQSRGIAIFLRPAILLRQGYGGRIGGQAARLRWAVDDKANLPAADCESCLNAVRPIRYHHHPGNDRSSSHFNRGSML